MSYQIYLYQKEEDAEQFLDYLSTLDVVIWSQNEFKTPMQIKDKLAEITASFMTTCIVIPTENMCYLPAEINVITVGEIGMEFLMCCRGNALSKAYDVGRIYYRSRECSPCNEAVIATYKKLKRFIRRNYKYKKGGIGVYIGPHFERAYQENKLCATWARKSYTF